MGDTGGYRGKRQDIERAKHKLLFRHLNPKRTISYCLIYFFFGRYRRLLLFFILTAVLIFAPLFFYHVKPSNTDFDEENTYYCLKNTTILGIPCIPYITEYTEHEIKAELHREMGKNQMIFRLLADVRLPSPDPNYLARIDLIIQKSRLLKSDLYAIRTTLSSQEILSGRTTLEESSDDTPDNSKVDKLDVIPDWENLEKFANMLDSIIGKIETKFKIRSDLIDLYKLLSSVKKIPENDASAENDACKYDIYKILRAANEHLAKLDGFRQHENGEHAAKEYSALRDRLNFFERQRNEVISLIDHVGIKSDADNSNDIFADNDKKASDIEYIALILKTTSPYLSSLLALLVVLFWHRIWVGRQYASGRGRMRTFFVLYVFAALLFYNVVLLNAYQHNSTISENPAHGSLSPFSLSQYETAVKEIMHRLEQEQDFYILKFTMIGALFAVFFRFLVTNGNGSPEKNLNNANFKGALDRLRQSKVAALFFWAAVIVNCILDTRLRYNAIICSWLGDWIHTLENSVDTSQLPGWETFLDAKPFSKSPFMQVAPTLLTSIVFAFTVILFMVQKENVSIRGNVSERLKRLHHWFGSMTFVLLAFSGLVEPGMVIEWFIPVIVWAVVGIAVFQKGPCSLNNHVFRGNEIDESVVGHAFAFHYIDFFTIPWYMRIISYIPFKQLRRRIVDRYDKNKYIYLETNDNPNDIIEIYRKDISSSTHDTKPNIWSFLYLKTNKEQKRRILEENDGMVLLNLMDKTEDGGCRKLLEEKDYRIVNWLEKHTTLLVDTSEETLPLPQRREDPLKNYEIKNPEKIMKTTTGAEQKDTLPIVSARYKRIFDFYQKHDPWILIIFELNAKNGDIPLILFSFKDGDKETYSDIVKKKFYLIR